MAPTIRDSALCRQAQGGISGGTKAISPCGKESTISVTTQASAATVHAGSDALDECWRPRPPSPQASSAMLGLLDGISPGAFLLTATHEGTRGGTVVRWVQPCAANPPMVTVAFRRGIATAPLVYDSRRFALCRIPQADRLLRATFKNGHGLGEDPFLSLRTFSTPNGCPVPASAVGWLECELAFNIDLEAECGLYVGIVCAGEIAGDA
jgi:flavin reductase (DIM6/NTAB) family NADH-FMN oxidoreductase RutF